MTHFFILQAGINLNKPHNSDELKRNLESLFFTNEWSRFSNSQKIQAIKKVIDNYITQNGLSNFTPNTTGTSNSLSNFTSNTTGNSDLLVDRIKEIQKHAKDSVQMQCKDDVMKVLDEDIWLLRDITANAVINAIGFERAFNSVIIKNVNLIRKASKGKKGFQQWIIDNAEKVMPSRFEKIKTESAIRESRKKILEAVKKVLDNLN